MTHKVCKIQGHQEFSPSHICTFQGCNQESRWACDECLSKETHQHNLTSNTHLMNQQQFKILIDQICKQDVIGSKNIYVEIQQYVWQIRKLIQVIREIMFHLQNFKKEIDETYQLSLFQANDLVHINDDYINYILNKQNKKQTYNNDLLSSVQKMTRYSSQIEQLVLKNILSKQTEIQTYDFKDFTKLKQNDSIQTAQISQNELYLAYGGAQKLLVIYDLNLKKKIKSLKLDQYIKVCQFSNDSKLLYVGCDDGYLYCLDGNFKQLYKQQIHINCIFNVIEIKPQVIITSAINNILITNIQLKLQILQIDNAHTNYIKGLAYSLQNDVLVSGSWDKSIKLFDAQSGQLIIQKQQAHDDRIFKIQLIDKKLLSLSVDKTLKYWQILLNQIQDKNEISNFNYVNQQIAIICKEYFKVLNEDFQLIKQIDHSQYKDVYPEQSNKINEVYYNMRIKKVYSSNQEQQKSSNQLNLLWIPSYCINYQFQNKNQ